MWLLIMEPDSAHLTPVATKELITFVAVAAICMALTIYLGITAPVEKRAADYLAHGIFSILFALPTGAAWRSFCKALTVRA